MMNFYSNNDFLVLETQLSQEKNEEDLRLKQMGLDYQMTLEMQQFKASFLARASHELRSPLCRLLSLNQLILSDLGEDPQEIKQWIHQSYESGKQLLGLLDELILISEVEQGSIPLKLQPVSLLELVEEVEKITALPRAHSQFHITVDSTESTVTIHGDGRWTRQVLLSLVTLMMKLMGMGTLNIHISRDHLNRAVVDFQGAPPPVWQEAIAAMNHPENPSKLEEFSKDFSPGFRLWVNQIILATMEGQLEFQNHRDITWLRCYFPLAQL